MISKSIAFTTTDGQTVATLAEAQRIELRLLLSELGEIGEPGEAAFDKTIDNIVANAAKVVDILTTKENSRPKARKVNGATRNKKNAGKLPVTVERGGT